MGRSATQRKAEQHNQQLLLLHPFISFFSGQPA